MVKILESLDCPPPGTFKLDRDNLGFKMRLKDTMADAQMRFISYSNANNGAGSKNLDKISLRFPEHCHYQPSLTITFGPWAPTGFHIYWKEGHLIYDTRCPTDQYNDNYNLTTAILMRQNSEFTQENWTLIRPKSGAHPIISTGNLNSETTK